MVLMSMDAYSDFIARLDTELKLKEAEFEAERTGARYAHDDVMSRMRKRRKDIPDEI
jgi:hypothetical protein